MDIRLEIRTPGCLARRDGDAEIHNDWTMYSRICDYCMLSPTCNSHISSPYKGSENILEDRVERLQELGVEEESHETLMKSQQLWLPAQDQANSTRYYFSRQH